MRMKKRLNVILSLVLGWYFRLLGDRLMGVSDSEAVHRKRGAELRTHLVQSGSVALIKVCVCLNVLSDVAVVESSCHFRLRLALVIVGTSSQSST